MYAKLAASVLTELRQYCKESPVYVTMYTNVTHLDTNTKMSVIVSVSSDLVLVSNDRE